MSGLRTRFALATAITAAFVIPQALISASASPPNGTITVAPSDPISGESFTVSGDFSDDTARAVWLQHKNSDGDWLTDDESTTNASGGYSFTTSITSDETIRAYEPPIPSESGNDGIPTDPVDVTVANTSGTLAISGNSSSSLTATSTFTPGRSGQSVTLQYSNDQTSWTTSKTGTQDGTGKTTFATVTGVPSYTRFYRAITTYPGAATPATSNTVSFTPSPNKVDNNLPVVRINTQGGSSISTRTHYFQMNMSIDSGDPANPAINAPAADVGAPTYKSPNDYIDQVKGRGNYSWSFPKKGFRIKLGSKAPLLGMPSSKHWVLMANFYDKSLTRNSAALFLSSKIFGNSGWTVKYKNVDLVVNGSYRGTYQLMEQVRIATNRVNIRSLSQLDDPAFHPCSVPNCITGGYLMEWNFRKDAPAFKTPSGSYISIDDPAPDANDPDEVTYNKSPEFKDQQTYIKNYVSDCDKKIYASNSGSPLSYFNTCLDTDSMIDWWLVNEITKNTDSQLYASAFMYKDINGPLTMGPAWDFDLSSGDIARSGNTVSSSGWYLRDSNAATARQVKTTWINKLFQNNAFKARVKVRWDEVKGDITASKVSAFIESEHDEISDSAAKNFGVWSINQHFSKYQQVKGSFSAENSYLKSWLSSRINWVNGQLN